ncbi:MAG TPA: hypothetical protein VMW67_08345 [Desulfobacteria bacterium]|nr:hypothetical protein [Desulfobacteria bacterium]
MGNKKTKTANTFITYPMVIYTPSPIGKKLRSSQEKDMAKIVDAFCIYKERYFFGESYANASYLRNWGGEVI